MQEGNGPSSWVAWFCLPGGLIFCFAQLCSHSPSLSNSSESISHHIADEFFRANIFGRNSLAKRSTTSSQSMEATWALLVPRTWFGWFWDLKFWFLKVPGKPSKPTFGFPALWRNPSASQFRSPKETSTINRVSACIPPICQPTIC